MRLFLGSSLGFGLFALVMARPVVGQTKAGNRVKLSAVIAAFLADSGVQTRGLPWTTGNGLAIKWQSAAPVRNPDQSARAKGLTHARSGSFMGTVGDSVALPMDITVVGTTLGLANVGINISSLEVSLGGSRGGFILHRGMVETALKNEGLTLQPIKCSRAKEGASYGNLVDAVKAPGKTASGLWWMWDSPQQQPTLSLMIMYRRADMAQVECQG
ncbi:MAG TPA: hypothetical protein VH762_17280 [Gemmatimonadaceae bacterium]